MTNIPSTLSLPSNGRGRRNWPAATYAEVFIRLTDHAQPVAHVARMTGLSLMQVHHFKSQLDAEPDKMPQNVTFPESSVFDTTRTMLDELVAHEAPRGRGRPPRPTLTPEQLASLQTEVEGCIDLVKQIEAAYPGMSARRFLRLCLADARSA